MVVAIAVRTAWDNASKADNNMNYEKLAAAIRRQYKRKKWRDTSASLGFAGFAKNVEKSINNQLVTMTADKLQDYLDYYTDTLQDGLQIRKQRSDRKLTAEEQAGQAEIRSAERRRLYAISKSLASIPAGTRMTEFDLLRKVGRPRMLQRLLAKHGIRGGFAAQGYTYIKTA